MRFTFFLRKLPVFATFTCALTCGWQTSAWAADSNSKLLLHLPLNQDINDASGRKQPIKAQGQVIIQDGAAYFSGHDSWLEAPSLPFNHPFAVSVWIKPTGTNAIYGLIEQRSADELNQSLHLMLREKLQPYLGFYLNDVISPLSIRASKWTHLVFQYDGVQQEIWINGHLVCQRKADPFQGSTGVLRIGKGPERNFEGYMADLRIFRGTLTPQEIAAFNSHVHPLHSPLPAYEETDMESAVLCVTPPAPPPPPTLVIDGDKLTIRGVAKQVYDLQMASNLPGNWSSIGTLTNSLGIIQFTIEYPDAEASTAPQRFYRLEFK